MQWTVMHHIPGKEGQAGASDTAAPFTALTVPNESRGPDVIAKDFMPITAGDASGGGSSFWLQPQNAVPGPKDKKNPEFSTRTVALEKAAQAQMDAGSHLSAFLNLSDHGNITSTTSPDCIAPVQSMSEIFSQIQFAPGQTLKIMGIQDNYKAWDRKNWRNGKPLILHLRSPERAPLPQLFFDDYIFTNRQGGHLYHCLV